MFASISLGILYYNKSKLYKDVYCYYVKPGYNLYNNNQSYVLYSNNVF